MTRHTTTEDLRAALTAAIPDLTEDQADAARALLEALAPPMEEPTWPGAPVIAGCGGTALRRLHTRRNDGPTSGWECAYSCESTSWHVLGNPRPLTPDEYRAYRIPRPAPVVTPELRHRCMVAGASARRADGNWGHIVDAILETAGLPIEDEQP